MNIDKAEYLVLNKMEMHGLGGWGFEWTTRVREHGRCSHTKRTIYLSVILTKIVEEAIVLNTILHEIAHALVGPGHGHGIVWKNKAKEVGCQPNSMCKRIITDDELPPKWVLMFGDEIISRWMRKPNINTILNVKTLYAKGRKAETLGKLRIIK